MKLSILVLLSSTLTLSAAKNVVDITKGLGNSKRDEQMPLFGEPKDNIYIPQGEEPQKGPTLITSGLSVNRDVSVFAGYARDNVDVSSRFNNRKKQTIVFAPTDSGVESLSLKPWQFPTHVDEEKSEEEKEQIITANIEDFVKSHLVDGEVSFSVLEGAKEQLGALLYTENGKRLKLVNDEGEYYVSPQPREGESEDWIKVETVKNVDNGAILVINTPLSKPSALL